MKILVTGTAGFIGAHVTERLLQRGDEVVGIDNINDYYDIRLKYARLALSGITPQNEQSSKYPHYRFKRMSLEDNEGIAALFSAEKFDCVCHLAAQAGVRCSITTPRAYIDSNIVGTLNILEGCRHNGVSHLVYASSSSVYGLNAHVPFSEHDSIAHPVSLYAATKKSNELMAHAYSHLYGVPTTGVRLFTVYGPWGRPDMAPYLFADAILNDRPINVFGEGKMLRDFTYIDDIVEGTVRAIDKPAAGNASFDFEKSDSATSSAPYAIYNIGNSQPVPLMEFIGAIEEACGKEAKKVFLPMQHGEMYQTYSDNTLLEQSVGFRPDTQLKDGVRQLVDWLREYQQRGN